MRLLLPLIFLFGCSPIKTTAITLKTEQELVTAKDSLTKEIVKKKSDECIKKALEIRAISGSEKAKEFCNSCVKDTFDKAEKIANLIDVIRTKNKIAAEIALSVAKKDKPIEVLTSLVPEITDLAKQLKELVDSI